jgi:hypothetical protein
MTVAYQTREEVAICAYCGSKFFKTGKTRTCSYECRDRRKIARDNQAWVKRKPIEDRAKNINVHIWGNPFRKPNYRRRAEYDPTGVLDDC